MALIECPKCQGAKCTFCNHTGRVVKATKKQKGILARKPPKRKNRFK